MTVFAKGSGGGGGGGGGENDKDSLFSGDAIEMVLGIAEGPLKGIKGATVAEQLNHIYLDGTPVLGKNGDKLFKSSQLVLSYERGTPVTEIEDPDFGQTPIPFVLGGSATPVSVSQTLSHNVPITRVTQAAFRNEYNKIEVRLLVSRLSSITDKGAKELTARVRIRYKLTTESVWKDASITVDGKTLSGGFVRSVDIYINDTSQDVQLEVTLMDVNDPETTNREIAWLAYELSNSLKQGDESRKQYHPNTAMLHLVAKVGENFSRVPNISAVWQGLLCSVPSNYNSETRVYNEVMPWNGSFNVHKQFTSNPFWIVRELILNPLYGMAKYNPSVSVDDYSLYEEAKYADTMRTVGPIGDQKRIPLFSFNGVITRPMLGMELINYILGSANAQAIEYDSGYIRIVSDRNTESVCTVMPETCIQQHEDVTFTYNLTDIKDRYNEIITSYIEPEMDWQPQFVGPYKDTEAQVIQGVNLYEYEAIGCTNPYEAEYKAYFRLLTAQTETLSVTFSIPLTALSWDIFDIVDIVDPDMDWGLSGRVQSIVNRLVTLRQPLYFEETGWYDFEVISKAGNRIKRSFEITVAGSHGQLTLSSSITSPLVQYPAFSITRDGFNPGKAKPFRVVSITPADGQSNIFTVTAIEVNRNKWAQALDSVIGKKPIYSYEQPRRPQAPTNLRMLDQYVLGSTRGSQNLVGLTWDGPTETFIGLAYILQVSMDGSPFTNQGLTRLNYTEYEVQPDIDYQFRVLMNYQGQSFYSNILGYEIPDYTFSDFDLSKLFVSLSGEYRENDLHYRIDAKYQFFGVGGSVDLLLTRKIKGAEIDFYRVNADSTQTFITKKTITTSENILLASEQLTSLDAVAPEIALTARLIALDGSYFPSMAIVAGTQIANIPTINGISVETTVRTVSAAASMSHNLKRNMNLRWFMGTDPNGADRKAVSESSQLFGFSVSPDTEYYVWCQAIGLYGEGAIFPPGMGVLAKTLKVDSGDLGFEPEKTVTVFKRADTKPTQLTAVQGTYDDPVPQGWSASVPTGTEPLWTCFRTYRLSGDHLAWTEPTLAERLLMAEYSLDGADWHKNFQAFDKYMRQSNDGGVTWTSAIKIVGEAGAGGDYVDYIFKRNLDKPETPTGESPQGWFDSPTAGTQPLWMSKAKKSAEGGLISEWSEPVRLTGESGVNALTGFLTNESHTVATDAAGNGADLSNAQGYFKVYFGVTDASASCEFSIVESSGMTATIHPSSGLYTVTAITEPTATVRFRAVYSGAIVEKVFNVTKSLAGAGGAPAKLVQLTADTQVFKTDPGGIVDPGNIVITAQSQGLSGAITWRAVGFTSAGQSTTVTLTGTGNSRTLSNTNLGSNYVRCVITASITEGEITYKDTLTIVRVADGIKGNDGIQGTRGTVTVYVEITSAQWSDEAADTALAALPYDGKIIADSVTQYYPTGKWAETRYWTGTAWLVLQEVINGSLLVKESITADKININDLYARNAQVTGSLIVGNETNYVKLGGSYHLDARGALGTLFRVGLDTGFLDGQYLSQGSIYPGALSQDSVDWLRTQFMGSIPTTGGKRSKSIALYDESTLVLDSLNSGSNPTSLSVGYGGDIIYGPITSEILVKPRIFLRIRRGEITVASNNFYGTARRGEKVNDTDYETIYELPVIDWKLSDPDPGTGPVIYQLDMYVIFGTYMPFQQTYGKITFVADQAAVGGSFPQLSPTTDTVLTLEYSGSELLVGPEHSGWHFYLTNPTGCLIKVKEAVSGGVAKKGIFVFITQDTVGEVRVQQEYGGVVVNSAAGYHPYTRHSTIFLLSRDRYLWQLSGDLA